jgi:hypothetical protein
VHSYIDSTVEGQPNVRVEAGGNMLVIHHAPVAPAASPPPLVHPHADGSEPCTVKLPQNVTAVHNANGTMVCSACSQFTDCARCAFSDRNSHSRMRFVPTPALDANMRATKGIPLGCSLVLPVATETSVQTLQSFLAATQVYTIQP